MKLELPDQETRSLGAEELRLELACALYARGKVSAVGGAHIAGIDVLTFQEAIKARGIPRNYSLLDLDEDMKSLKKLFPE